VLVFVLFLVLVDWVRSGALLLCTTSSELPVGTRQKHHSAKSRAFHSNHFRFSFYPVLLCEKNSLLFI
jgi:hypothetical protein